MPVLSARDSAQSLFIGKHAPVVGGQSDLRYLKAFSEHLCSLPTYEDTDTKIQNEEIHRETATAPDRAAVYRGGCAYEVPELAFPRVLRRGLIVHVR